MHTVAMQPKGVEQRFPPPAEFQPVPEEDRPAYEQLIETVTELVLNAPGTRAEPNGRDFFLKRIDSTVPGVNLGLWRLSLDDGFFAIGEIGGSIEEATVETIAGAGAITVLDLREAILHGGMVGTTSTSAVKLQGLGSDFAVSFASTEAAVTTTTRLGMQPVTAVDIQLMRSHSSGSGVIVQTTRVVFDAETNGMLVGHGLVAEELRASPELDGQELTDLDDFVQTTHPWPEDVAARLDATQAASLPASRPLSPAEWQMVVTEHLSVDKFFV